VGWVLTWSIIVVSVLFAGAAGLAVLAARLRDEGRRLEASLDALASLQPVGTHLDDEIVLTRARRTERSALPLGAPLGAP